VPPDFCCFGAAQLHITATTPLSLFPRVAAASKLHLFDRGVFQVDQATITVLITIRTMVRGQVFFVLLSTIISVHVAAAKELIPIKTGKSKHILELGYHPLPQQHLYTASCRYHSHESGKQTGKAAVRRSEVSHANEWGTKKTFDNEQYNNDISSDDERRTSLEVRMRFDHAWDVFVGWVDNAKSDSEVSHPTILLQLVFYD
jgi:hypothetical protein